MRLKYEPSSEPLHISTKKLFLKLLGVAAAEREWNYLTGFEDFLQKNFSTQPAQNTMRNILARMSLYEGRCRATWKTEFKFPWREAGPPNHHDDKVDSDQKCVNKELSLSLPGYPGRVVAFSMRIEETDPIPIRKCVLRSPEWLPYRGTSLIRNTHPPRITIGP